ncbi:MAG: hypothetical protein Q4C54_07395, partial [Clostridia bacterium]|nr:hypothetical protein [Clostridia bacterium]
MTLKLNGGNHNTQVGSTAAFTVIATVTDAFWDDKPGKTADVVNRAALTVDGKTQNAQSTTTISKPKKSKIVSKSGSDSTNGRVSYSVLINPNRLECGGTLHMKDVMKANANNSDQDVQLFNLVGLDFYYSDAYGAMGERIPDSEIRNLTFRFAQDPANVWPRKYIVEADIPDATQILVRYTYALNSNYKEETYGKVVITTNEVTITGQGIKSSETTTNRVSYDSTVRAKTIDLSLRKVEEGQPNIGVAGAKLVVMQYVDADKANAIPVAYGISDASGRVKLTRMDGSAFTWQLGEPCADPTGHAVSGHPDKEWGGHYYIDETEIPAGYEKVSGYQYPDFVMYFDENTPHDGSVATKLKGGESYYFNIPNKNSTIVVRKQWYNDRNQQMSEAEKAQMPAITVKVQGTNDPNGTSGWQDVGTYPLNKDNGWKLLIKPNEGFGSYRFYRVQEINVPDGFVVNYGKIGVDGTVTEWSQAGSVGETLLVNNKLKKELTVVKKWVSDLTAKTEIAAPTDKTVTIHLMSAPDNDGPWTQADTVTLPNDGKWYYTWGEGTLNPNLYYKVEEESQEGIEVAYDNNGILKGTITVYNKQALGSLKVKKAVSGATLTDAQKQAMTF